MTFYDDAMQEFTMDKEIAGLGMARKIRQSTRINIDNVLRYYAETLEDADDFHKQLGALTPPFRYTWLEMGHPETYRVENEVMDWPPFGFRRACVFMQCDETRASEAERWRVTFMIMFDFPPQFVEIPDVPEASHYPSLTGYFVLNAKGISERETFTYQPSYPVDEKLGALLQFSYAVLSDTMLLALSFLNCKNVSLESVPGVPSRQISKRLNTWSRPESGYHVVKIEPLGKVRAADATPGGATGSPGGTQRLHIVRGHFRTYTEDKPLFGRPGLFGQFWIPQRMQGKAEAGEISSEYEVDI